MITFKDFLLSKVVCEARYPNGHIYWDRTGHTINQIEKELTEWKWEKLENGQMLLRNNKRKMKTLYGWNRFWMHQKHSENLNQLKINCDKLYKIITENLEIKKLKRIGNRYWFVLPTKSIDEADTLIAKGKIFNQEISKLNIFKSKVIARDYTIILQDEDDFRYRIAVSAVERQPEPILDKDKEFSTYNPLNGILVDIDVFKHALIATEDFAPSDFIQKSYKKVENNLLKLFQ